MNLLDFVNRRPVPVPWEEGDNIPWHDPEFSRRMLQEHLNQAHDRASRRLAKIDRHVSWIHEEILRGQATRILDLGCGPGLYTSRLARLGHECVGIDFSPSSIAYAQEQSQKERLACTYVHDDIRAADLGSGFGLVMLLFGEFNVFSPLDIRAITRRVAAALTFDGVFLIEPHTFTAVQAMGRSGSSWYTSQGGLFAGKPHLCLQESFWDAANSAATTRYFIIDGASRQVAAHAQSFQAYTAAGYEEILRQRGLEEIQYYPSLLGVKDPEQSDLLVITAREATEGT